MASLLFALTAAVLLAFTADAAVMKQTVTWQIDVTAFFKYSSTTQRTSLLNQILSLWKSSFDASSGLSNEKVSVVSDSAVPGFPGYKQMSFRITGQSTAGVNVQTLVTKFMTILQGANIAGVSTTLGGGGGSSSSGGGGGGMISGGGGTINWEIQVSGTFQYASSAVRDKILQQILALWTKSFGGQNGFKNQKVTVVSESAGPMSGTKQLTFKITGSSNAGVDVQALIQAFIPIVQSAHIVGVQSITTEGGGDNGGDNGSGNGGGGGGGSFTWNGNSVITFKTQAELDKILNQILQLWIKTYSVQYHITPGAQITVVSKKPAGGGKFTITYKITYSGDNSVSETTDDFQTIISNNQINGVVINGGGGGDDSGNGSGNGGSGGSYTWNGNVVVTFKTQADLDKIMNQLLQLWIKTYTVQYHITPGAQITVVSKKPAGGGKFTITYKITYSGDNSVTETTDDFQTIISNNQINGIVINGGGGGGGDDSGNGSGNGGSGGSFTWNGNVVVTYKTQADLDKIMNQILQLWIKTYTVQYHIAPGAKVTIISKQPGAGGKFTITYKITYSGDSSVTETDSDFDNIINGAHITGVVISGGGDSGDNNGGGGQFSIQNTVVIKVSSAGQISGYLQKILALWIQTYSKQYKITGQKIVQISAQSTTPGYFTVTYQITGSSSVTIDADQNNADFNKLIAAGKIVGVSITITTSGGGGGNFDVSENQKNGRTVGPGNFDVVLTVYLSYRTAAERQNFLDRLKVIWNNALNDYQVTSLAVKFKNEQLNVGTLPKDLGGGPVNKVWYRLTGSTVNAFNTAEVSKVFEETVVAAHLGGVEFTLQK